MSQPPQQSAPTDKAAKRKSGFGGLFGGSKQNGSSVRNLQSVAEGGNGMDRVSTRDSGRGPHYASSFISDTTADHAQVTPPAQQQQFGQQQKYQQQPQQYQRQQQQQQQHQEQQQQQQQQQARLPPQLALPSQQAAQAIQNQLKHAFDLIAAQPLKVYQTSPPTVKQMLAAGPDGKHPRIGPPGTPQNDWAEVWVELRGVILHLWNMKEVAEANARGQDQHPTRTNITDSFVDLIAPLPPTQHDPESGPHPWVFSLNTVGKNSILFSCSTKEQLYTWVTALRLAAWEKSRLEEIYTGHLLRAYIVNRPGAPDQEPFSPLVNGQMGGWCDVRTFGNREWTHYYVVLASTPLQRMTTGPSILDARPAPDANPGKKNRMSRLFNSSSDKNASAPLPIPGEDSPTRELHSDPMNNANPHQMTAYFYRTQPKGKSTPSPSLVLTNATQIFAVYPEDPAAVSSSALFKVEGKLEGEGLTTLTYRSDGWLLMNPVEKDGDSFRPGKMGDMLKWIVGFHDCFGLYGRPGGYSWDPRDPRSLFFAHPHGENKQLLFLANPDTSRITLSDSRTSYVRGGFQDMLFRTMTGGEEETRSSDLEEASNPEATPPLQLDQQRPPPQQQSFQLPPLSFDSETEQSPIPPPRTLSEPPLPAPPQIPSSEGRNGFIPDTREGTSSPLKLQTSHLIHSPSGENTTSSSSPSNYSHATISASKVASPAATSATTITSPKSSHPAAAPLSAPQRDINGGSSRSYVSAKSSDSDAHQSGVKTPTESPTVQAHLVRSTSSEILQPPAPVAPDVPPKSPRRSVEAPLDQPPPSMPSPQMDSSQSRSEEGSFESRSPYSSVNVISSSTSLNTSPSIGGTRGPPSRIAGVTRRPSGARALPPKRNVSTELGSAMPTVEDTGSVEPSPIEPSASKSAAHHPVAPSDDHSADALAAFSFLDQHTKPPSASLISDSPVAVSKELPPSPDDGSNAPISLASHEELSTTPSFPSSFGPSKAAAERKAKAEAAEQSRQENIHRPGRSKSRGTDGGRSVGKGTWAESSDEDESEEDEEDEEEEEQRPSRVRPLPAQPVASQTNLGNSIGAASSSITSGKNFNGTQPQRDMSRLDTQRTLPQSESFRGIPQPVMPVPLAPPQPLYAEKQRSASQVFQQYDPSPDSSNGDSQQLFQPQPRAAKSSPWTENLGAHHGDKKEPIQTFVSLEPASTVTKAFNANGLLQAGIQDKEDRSAKKQEEMARESGSSLINVPSKPPPPQTGLLGAITAHERDRVGAGGVGATLTEKERDRRLAEERQRKIDELQRQQLEHYQSQGQGAPSPQPYPYGGYGMPPMGYGQPWGVYPPMMPPQGYPGMDPGHTAMMAAQAAAAMAYQQAMMAYSQAGSEAGGAAYATQTPSQDSNAPRSFSPPPVMSPYGMPMMPMMPPWGQSQSLQQWPGGQMSPSPSTFFMPPPVLPQASPSALGPTSSTYQFPLQQQSNGAGSSSRPTSQSRSSTPRSQSKRDLNN